MCTGVEKRHIDLQESLRKFMEEQYETSLTIWEAFLKEVPEGHALHHDGGIFRSFSAVIGMTPNYIDGILTLYEKPFSSKYKSGTKIEEYEKEGIFDSKTYDFDCEEHYLNAVIFQFAEETGVQWVL